MLALSTGQKHHYVSEHLEPYIFNYSVRSKVLQSIPKLLSVRPAEV